MPSSDTLLPFIAMCLLGSIAAFAMANMVPHTRNDPIALIFFILMGLGAGELLTAVCEAISGPYAAFEELAKCTALIFVFTLALTILSHRENARSTKTPGR